MNDEPTQSGEPPADAGRGESEWERKRRLAAVFGDVLPDTTDDERDGIVVRIDEEDAP